VGYGILVATVALVFDKPKQFKEPDIKAYAKQAKASKGGWWK
jgi:hypothetical protein